MFELSEQMHYYMCQEYVNMNKGIDGLYHYIVENMPFSPLSGDVFVFFSKNRKCVKLLKWDTDGFLLYTKRLQKGTFEKPQFNTERGTYELSWTTFYFIMKGISLDSIKYKKRFQIVQKSNVI